MEHETRLSGQETWFGTLLGPEETPGWVLFSGVAAPGLDRLTQWEAMCLPGVVVVVLVGVWLCVECCIVDASILLWLKCIRAHGGCLGIRSR